MDGFFILVQEICMSVSEHVGSGIRSIMHAGQVMHGRFRDVRLFGPVAFGLLTVSLMLPPFGGASTDAVKYVLLLFSFALVCFSLRKGIAGSVIPWFNKWVLLFIGWLTVVTFLARDPLTAFMGGYSRYNSSWLLFALFAAIIWICVYLGVGVRTAIERLVLGISFCISVFGLLQSFGLGFYGGIGSTLSAVPDRVPSLVGNPNFSSWFVAVVLPFAVLYLFRARTAASRIWWAVFTFLSVWSLVIFSSRGSLLAALIGYGVLTCCVLLLRKWRMVVVLVVIGVFAVSLFSGFYTLYRPGQSGTASVIRDSSANDRYVAWDMAGEMLEAHPLTGVGPGNFDQYYWELLPTTRMGGDQYFDDAHNVLLSILAELGIPGFLFITFLFGAAGAIVVRKLFVRGTSKELGSWIAAAAGLAAWLVAALFNPTVIALWVLLAVLLAIIFLEDKTQDYTLRMRIAPRLAWVMSGVLACVLAVGLLVGEYSLVYIIAIEPYHGYPQVASQQSWITRAAAMIEPYHMETRYAAIFIQTRNGLAAPEVRKRIQSAFQLHPYSTRSALVAAQLTADLWYRDHEDGDLKLADQYLHTALQRSSGYPVVESWAAIYYWRTNRPALAQQYAGYATYKQPHYLDNWLLLAKIYREKNNLKGMEFALSRAQELVPGNVDLAKMRKQLRDTGDVHAVELRPGELSTLTRLH